MGISARVWEAKGSEDVRYEHITLDSEFTLDRLRLQLAIDLDDLLRDIGVLGIGKWDANGTWAPSLPNDMTSISDLTFYAIHRTWLVMYGWMWGNDAPVPVPVPKPKPQPVPVPWARPVATSRPHV